MNEAIRLNHALMCLNETYRDPRVARTFGVFERLGLVKPTGPRRYDDRRQVTLEDALWTCANVAPALHQLVPAVVLRHSVRLPGEWPPDLKAVVDCLRADDQDGPGFRDFAYWRIRSWAQRAPANPRALGPLSCRVNYQLPVALVARLRAQALSHGVTQTALLKAALEMYLK